MSAKSSGMLIWLCIAIFTKCVSSLAIDDVKYRNQAASQRIQELSTKLHDMQSVIEKSHLVEAFQLAGDIALSVSPAAEDGEIQVVFQFINQSLARYVPLIGGEQDTADFQAQLSVYHSLLSDISLKDDVDDPQWPEMRLIRLHRLRDLTLSVLNGLGRGVKQSLQGYHFKFQELERITAKMDEMYIRLVHPVPGRWMRLMKDAAILQTMQPLKDGISDSNFNRMIDRLYTTAIHLFVKEIVAIKGKSKFDEAARSEMFWKIRRIVHQVPVNNALEYCVLLSKNADPRSDIASFQQFVQKYYYARLDGEGRLT